ncbi:MAG: chemotaxis-specific protein-glutamate methyltransferase CheB [Rhodocyclaceae bacterium]|nr:MAG: chemotaxis-specific protein-glutamate methyltransferase CheB [Rhodocyclaceae bacterium]
MNPQPATGNGNGNGKEIRVLLVDDSSISLEFMRRMLASAAEINVVGTARDGLEALELIPRLRPDVMCTDLHMPKMDGLALTREVMARDPMPILVLSISLQAQQQDNIFRMLEAGALDILAKPRGGLDSDFSATAKDLIQKIRILSGVKVIRRHHAKTAAAPMPVPSVPLSRMSSPDIIGIGASTGGPQAFEHILAKLPADFPLPLLCVQHIAQGFMPGLVSWLASTSRIRVTTAIEGTPPQAGTAYFPADNRHLEIDSNGLFRCSSGLPVGGHRPSVDMAFSSLARRYGAAAAGVLLTGMGQDGARGLLDIERAGGLTIAQDEGSSVVFGMPKCAIELGAARHVLPLERIGTTLCDLAARAAPSKWRDRNAG